MMDCRAVTDALVWANEAIWIAQARLQLRVDL
jgi:hypothetical protein